MAEFIAPNPRVEVSGAYVMSVVHAIKRGTEYRLEVLAKHGILNPQLEHWYPVQFFLDALKEIYTVIGDINMLAIGKEAARRQEMPPQVTNIRQAFEMLHIANSMNHRLDGRLLFDASTGETSEGIGKIILLEYEEQARRALVCNTTPYSIHNFMGWLQGFVERYRPSDSTRCEVKEDITRERASLGGTSTTCIVSW